MQSVNIILADAQQLVRAGFRFLLQEEENLKVVGEAERPKRLQKLLETTQVEVLIFDYHNSDAFSIDDICKIKGAFPDIQILVVTADDNKQNIFSVLECGVSSILTKNCSKEEIINAIEATAKSEKFFCNAVLDILLEKHLGTNEKETNCLPTYLTVREVEVLELIAEGISTKEIAGHLSLSTHTIYTHRKNIMKKLKINSVSEMILYALKTGIVKHESR